MKEERINSQTEVSTSEIAAVLGISVRRVQQLAQDGKFAPVRRGKYLLTDVVRKYIELQSEDARISDEQVDKAVRKKAVADARLKTAKADVAELESAELKGKMHRAEDIEVLTDDMIYTIRSALNALPGRLAVDCFHAVNEAQCADIIRHEVHSVMRELAGYEYDPEKYAQRVRDRQEWQPEQDEEKEEE